MPSSPMMSPQASSTVPLNPTPILNRRSTLPLLQRCIRPLYPSHHSSTVHTLHTETNHHDVVPSDSPAIIRFFSSHISGTDINNMGSEVASGSKKPRFLCLHGFRTSGLILETQIHKWPESVLQNLDLVYLDGPFPAHGKSDVEGIFDPPYYEWFQFNKEHSEYPNFDKCLEFIEDYMIKNGPFDGLLGFSQGAILSAALPGLQAKGLAFTKVPKIKFLVVIGGAKFKSPTIAENAYSSPIQIPSLHFLGENDFLKPYGLELLKVYVDPTVIHHPKGHTIPRLDEKGLETMMSFIETIQKQLDEEDDQSEA